jgi:hypothetical protein
MHLDAVTRRIGIGHFCVIENYVGGDTKASIMDTKAKTMDYYAQNDLENLSLSLY